MVRLVKSLIRGIGIGLLLLGILLLAGVSSVTAQTQQVTTEPSGLQIVVDGVTLTAPQSFTWGTSTSHTLNAPSPQILKGKRYLFDGWNDGGAQSHTITAPGMWYYRAYFSNEEGSLDVTLTCPATITPGATLNVGITVKNKLWRSSVSAAKSSVAVHLGNFNIIGPFVIPLSGTVNSGQTIAIPNYLSVPYPADAARGTFNNLAVSVMSDINGVMGAGYCTIEVQ